MKLMKINVNTITIGLIIGGMILSSSLQVKAFTPTSNTAACVTTLATNAAVSQANANKEREQGKNKEPDILTTPFGFVVLCFSFTLLFICLSVLDGSFFERRQ